MIATRILLLLLTLACVAGATPIDSLAGVRALTAEQAARHLPVEVEGTVLGVDPASPWNFMLHDGKTSCFIRLEQVGSPPVVAPATRVRVRGSTHPAGYFPSVSRASVTLLGPGTLPAPARPGAEQLFSPAMDAQWVEVPAMVVGYESGKERFTLDLLVFGLAFKAEIPPAADAATRAAALLQRPVTLRGILGTIYNRQGQMTERHFFLSSMDALVPTTPPPGDQSLPLLTVGTLLTRQYGPESLVRIEGIVTQQADNGLYLRGPDGSTLVVAAHAEDYPPGTRITADGYGAMAPFRPILRAARVEALATGPPPAPVPFTFETADLQAIHAEWVTLEASYLGERRGNGDIILQCQAGQRVFDAILPAAASPPADLSPGDRLQLTGICELTTTEPLPRLLSVNGFRVLLPATGGVRILSQAPWWTPNRLLYALCLVTGLALLAVTATALLRRQVKNQLAIIAGNLRNEAIGEERDRMARDLHDSLEQQLAGVSLQLDGLEDLVKQDPARVPAVLAMLRRMLRYMRKEARRSVWDLRSRELERHGLAAALQAVAHSTLQSPGSGCRVEITGTPRSLPANVEFHLLRIAQEAMANAIKHSGANLVTVHIDYTDAALRLSVQDNGHGFDPAAAATPGQHFGLLGMRERAAKIGANLDIHSAPGSGCTLTVAVPMNPP